MKMVDGWRFALRFDAHMTGLEWGVNFNNLYNVRGNRRDKISRLTVTLTVGFAILLPRTVLSKGLVALVRVHPYFF